MESVQRGNSEVLQRSYGRADRLLAGDLLLPKCTAPTVVIVKDRPVMNLHRSHIVAAESGGPRDETAYTVEQRNSFENLILLCYPHHLLVDKLEPGNFPKPVLLQWKSDRERAGLAVLNGLGNLTEAKLQELIVDALDAQIESVRDAIDRFERHDFGDGKGTARPGFGRHYHVGQRE